MADGVGDHWEASFHASRLQNPVHSIRVAYELLKDLYIGLVHRIHLLHRGFCYVLGHWPVIGMCAAQMTSERFGNVLSHLVRKSRKLASLSWIRLLNVRKDDAWIINAKQW
jgi:hypothetical protein